MKTQLRDILESAEYLEYRHVERKSVDALENFLVSNSIELSKEISINAATAARWGQPLLYLKELYADPFLLKFSKAFSGKASLNEDAFSEVQALALLRALGATSAGIVERTSEKTHDFDVGWNDENIEVEVTRAGPKDANVILGQQAETLAGQLHSSSRNFDVIVHISRFLNTDEVERLVDASYGLNSGDIKEEIGVWQLVGKKITREPGVIEVAGESHLLPKWWRRGLALFNLFAILQPIDSKLPTPRVVVYFSPVFEGYLNSARKKAQRFQGSAQLPYLVVIDVSNLPGSFQNFEKGLTDCFPLWQRVTAVLLFENHRASNHVGWTFQLFKNPVANRPLAEGAGGMGDLASSQLILPIPS